MTTPHPLERDLLLKALPRSPAGDPILGSMHLQSRLGKGAMGAVYKGHHPRLNVAVAVKVLPPNRADPQATEQAARWFQREAQLLWQVQSTNVVRVSDVGQDAATALHYMVMDYVHGMPLSRFIDAYEGFMVRPAGVAPAGGGAAEAGAARGTSEAIAARICLAAARGLEALHEKNIIHRDIKPDNILIPYRSGHQRLNDITELDFDKTQLVDLGIARQEKDDTGTQQGLILGTPAYMSPEQARGLDVAKPSDVYALGATLYFLLAGQAPFQGKNPAELVVQVAHEAPLPIERFCPGLSAPTREFLATCMHKNPAQRFADGRELRRAAERLAGEIPPDAQTRRLFQLPENSAIAAAVPAQMQMQTQPPSASSATAPTHRGTPGTKPRRSTGSKLPPVAPTDQPAAPTATKGSTSKQTAVAGAGANTTGRTGKTRASLPPANARAQVKAKPQAAPVDAAEPVHAVDFTPAFGDSDLALQSDARAYYETKLARLRAMDDVYTTWMMLPIALWGGLTAGGAIWNGNLFGAIVVALVTGGCCVLPYWQRGHWRKVAAGLSLVISLSGWVALEQVGQILIPAARRALQGTSGGASVNDWLQTLVVGLLALLSCVAVGYDSVFYYHRWRKQKFEAELAVEIARLEAKKRKAS